jgi:cation:H+ antiporter
MAGYALLTMNYTTLVWLQFALCAAVIGLAGVRLSRYADAIAGQTGLSRNWTGLVLMATVTSLPELATGLSAVTVARAPDIAVGNVLGACVFNLAILALVDLLYRPGSLYSEASSRHVLTLGFCVVLLASAGLALLLSSQGMMPALGHVSLASPVLFAMYLVAVRVLYLTEQRHCTSPPGTEHPNMTLKAALMGYGVASGVIVGAGIWLPLISVKLAVAMGWSDSFVGTLFVAFATTVPELATTWGAVRLGAIDMAIGNLLGSNLFDVLILAIVDFAYMPGPIYTRVSNLHAISALMACLMSGVVLVALSYRPVSRAWHRASWTSLVLLALYLLNAAIQYQHGE